MINIFHMCRGLCAVVCAGFVACSMLVDNGPFRRPHPIFWRGVFSLSLVYLVILIYVCFQASVYCSAKTNVYSPRRHVTLHEHYFPYSTTDSANHLPRGPMEVTVVYTMSIIRPIRGTTCVVRYRTSSLPCISSAFGQKYAKGVKTNHRENI